MPVAFDIPPISDPGRRLAGRVAIVTGAGSSGALPGTGVAIAALFALQGAEVGVVDISPERAGDQGGPELRDRRRRAGLLGTEGTAWDAAWAALFLASDESRWITGVVLPVDAGATATTALGIQNLERRPPGR